MDPLEGPCAQLSEGQRDALRLVAAQMTSKEIAVELGISPHTVDQRIRQSLQILDVPRRQQAARMLLEAEAKAQGIDYQQLIYQAPHIASPDTNAETDATTGNQIRHAGRAGGAAVAAPKTEQGNATRFSLPLPFATRSRPHNTMGYGTRLAWIVLIAIGASFGAGMYMAGLESLSRFLSG